MPKAKSHVSDKVAASAIAHDDVLELLQFVTSPEILAFGIVERRQKLLKKVAELIRADLGIWSWGRGFSVDGGILPVAMIETGMTNAQKALLAEAGLERDNDLEFRGQIIKKMDASRQITLCRTELYPDAVWDTFPSFRRMSNGLGMDTWITSIRYPNADTWCNITYWRKPQAVEFQRTECELVDLMLGQISWLLPAASEYLPPEVFEGLTPRQRSVLVLLLDGMPRKMVAKHLGLTEHTIGDHIKSIYRVFNVHSLGEITAKLLKST